MSGAGASARTQDPIRVLVVDDSVVYRELLVRELSKDPAIDVVGEAPDAFVARDKILELDPDVVTLDIEMPRMDGLTFLRKLMQHFPLPVIVVSSLTERGSKVALEALFSGGFDVVCKAAEAGAVSALTKELVEKVKAAAASSGRSSRWRARPVPEVISASLTDSRERSVIGVGASTGGPRAVYEVLARMPSTSPPILIVQHMPPSFTRAFAERLDGTSGLSVKEARSGDDLVSGAVLVVPGDRHAVVRAAGNGYRVELRDGPLVCGHRPSVNVLFKSMAQTAGSDAIGVLLTGMGVDGASGLTEIRESGGRTYAQSEDSCVVFGMPRRAIEEGGVDEVLPVERIAARVSLELERRSTAQASQS